MSGRAAVRRLLPPDCQVTVDGAVVDAREGESVAALLLASGGWRPFHCGMGVCFECVVTIDGVTGQRGCVVPVRVGMEIETGAEEDPRVA
jgi:hypothetical protein